MTPGDLFAQLFRYNDATNDLILTAAEPLADDRLDERFNMGLGSLRRTLRHILAGEETWLARWRGQTETPWPDENILVPVGQLAARLAALRPDRDEFLKTRIDKDLATSIPYRDSRGTLFQATLSDMILQMFVHSAHHRAQAVNMLRRLGVQPPEVDLMVWARRPV